MLRQCHTIRLRDTEMRFQIPDLRHIRPKPGHDRRTRGTANGLLAIRIIKNHAASRDAVNVGRLDDLVAVTTQFRSHVINGDEKNVGRVSSQRRVSKADCQNEGSESDLHIKLDNLLGRGDSNLRVKS